MNDYRRYDFCVPCFSLFIRAHKDHPAFKTYTKCKKKYAQPSEIGAIYTAFRRAIKKSAMPPWADRRRIVEIYLQARALTRTTGVPYHVDHIVPLCSPVVCGLHIPANLQILTDSANMEKGNRLDMDAVVALMENDWRTMTGKVE